MSPGGGGGEAPDPTFIFPPDVIGRPWGIPEIDASLPGLETIEDNGRITPASPAAITACLNYEPGGIVHNTNDRYRTVLHMTLKNSQGQDVHVNVPTLWTLWKKGLDAKTPQNQTGFAMYQLDLSTQAQVTDNEDPDPDGRPHRTRKDVSPTNIDTWQLHNFQQHNKFETMGDNSLITDDNLLGHQTIMNFESWKSFMNIEGDFNMRVVTYVMRRSGNLDLVDDNLREVAIWDVPAEDHWAWAKMPVLAVPIAERASEHHALGTPYRLRDAPSYPGPNWIRDLSINGYHVDPDADAMWTGVGDPLTARDLTNDLEYAERVMNAAIDYIHLKYGFDTSDGMEINKWQHEGFQQRDPWLTMIGEPDSLSVYQDREIPHGYRTPHSIPYMWGGVFEAYTYKMYTYQPVDYRTVEDTRYWQSMWEDTLGQLIWTGHWGVKQNDVATPGGLTYAPWSGKWENNYFPINADMPTIHAYADPDDPDFGDRVAKAVLWIIENWLPEMHDGPDEIKKPGDFTDVEHTQYVPPLEYSLEMTPTHVIKTSWPIMIPDGLTAGGVQKWKPVRQMIPKSLPVHDGGLSYGLPASRLFKYWYFNPVSHPTPEKPFPENHVKEMGGMVYGTMGRIHSTLPDAAPLDYMGYDSFWSPIYPISEARGDPPVQYQPPMTFSRTFISWIPVIAGGVSIPAAVIGEFDWPILGVLVGIAGACAAFMEKVYGSIDWPQFTNHGFEGPGDDLPKNPDGSPDLEQINHIPKISWGQQKWLFNKQDCIDHDIVEPLDNAFTVTIGDQAHGHQKYAVKVTDNDRLVGHDEDLMAPSLEDIQNGVVSQEEVIAKFRKFAARYEIEAAFPDPWRMKATTRTVGFGTEFYRAPGSDVVRYKPVSDHLELLGGYTPGGGEAPATPPPATPPPATPTPTPPPASPGVMTWHFDTDEPFHSWNEAEQNAIMAGRRLPTVSEMQAYLTERGAPLYFTEVWAYCYGDSVLAWTGLQAKDAVAVGIGGNPLGTALTSLGFDQNNSWFTNPTSSSGAGQNVYISVSNAPALPGLPHYTGSSTS